MSANEFAVKPELSESFPNFPRTWTCPVSGFVVPKDPVENLQWRAKLLRAAQKDIGLQKALYTASSQSLLFWINTFVWTYRVFESDGNEGAGKQAEDQHVPFVTWPVQDEHMTQVEHAINNAYSLLTDKSRDMGASWTHAVVFHHQWLFRPDSLFLEMSRTEKYVDDAGNPKSLFFKHDYINKWLPEWMKPRVRRTYMKLQNLDNGSRIDGEATTAAAASGDRRRAVLLDEMAKMAHASKVKGSLRDVSKCLLPNSTAWGAGTAYSQWRNSGKIKVALLPWWEHPEKGIGRYVKQEENGKWKIRSPWYDHEESIRSPKEMAQDIDMDHIGSGDTFFEATNIEQHKALFVRPARVTRAIDFKKGTATDAIPQMLVRKQRSAVRVGAGGKWRIWTNLIDGRPDQSKNYILGIDISKGQGASNSVISIMCAETREKIAEFADANTPPYDLARIAVAAALWCGGARNRLPLMIWEANGPGWDFGRQVVKIYQYPYFYTDRAVGTVREKQGKRYGWHSSREKKEIVLGMYRRALAHGGFINHSEEALAEALTYIYYENGGLGPAFLMEESAEARKTHGDRVIADMLCLLGVEEAPKTKSAPPSAPQRSPAYRKAMLVQKRKKAKMNKTFDFRGIVHA
jgi:hypothetical protein